MNKAGLTLIQSGKYLKAIEILQQAIQLSAQDPQTNSYLAYACEQAGDYENAEKYTRITVDLRPQSPEAHNNLGNVLKLRGKAKEAIQCFRQALAIQPDFTGVYSNLLLCLNYVPEVSLAEIFEEHTRWASTITQPGNGEKISPTDNEHRKIRLGYVSPDFRNHPVTNFFLPVITHHNKQKFEVYCYAEVANSDRFSQEIAERCHSWVNTCALSDHELAEKIRSDKIDILLDLAGHTRGNRLGVFAMKPAAVQVTYLGYPNTTGLKSIDYRITDEVLDPVGSEQFYTEQLYRLPGGISCYRPPLFYPELETPPFNKNGYITFGSFNNPAKFNARTFALWAKVLDAVPNSRLLLYRNVFRAAEKASLTRLCAEHGIAKQRLTIMDQPPADDSLPPARRYLRVMSMVDICLDTFPWSGHTTACEALWMGVPVITLYGDRPSSRLCSSVLKQLDLSQLSAATENDYVKIAEKLAGQAETLNELRHNLRHKMQTSIIGNEKAFTRSLETFYCSILKKQALPNVRSDS